MSSYSFDDPWTSNGAVSSPAAAQSSSSSSSRPLTWAPPSGSETRSSTLPSYSNSSADRGRGSRHGGGDDEIDGVRLPESYERAWQICRRGSSEQQGIDGDHDDGDISLGQLGKLVRSAQGLNAADVERVINASCSSSSAHCTKREFALALLLIAQIQAGSLLDVSSANDKLLSGDELDEPTLDFGKLQSSALMSKVNSTAGTDRSSEDPWMTTTGKQDSNNGRGSGLPVPSSSSSPFTSSTLRGGWQEETGGPGSKSPLNPPVYIDPTPCSVHLLPQLGGYLFFRHVLYLVKSPLSAGVKRRYSDFVSLHEYLIVRYPFRLVPPLPPKRLALPHMNKTQAVGSGQQDVFLEQRRLSLARYSRNVISHPVFHRDSIVTSFFSMGSSGGIGGGISGGNGNGGSSSNGLTDDNVSSWKIPSNADSVVEEGLDESWRLSDSETMSVPVDMEEKLASTRKMVSLVVDRWNNTVAVFERQVRRMEATAAESTRLSLSLSSLLEVEAKTFQSSHYSSEDIFGQSTNLLISNSQDYSDLSTARFNTLQRTLDALKNSRDVWLSLKELFKRHDKLGGDPIQDLTSRIEANRKRWKSTIEEKKPNWQETCTRLKEEIVMDQKLIERYGRRNKKVRVALWHEITRLQHLKNLIIVDWKLFARSEAVNLAATKQAAEELVVALEGITRSNTVDA